MWRQHSSIAVAAALGMGLISAGVVQGDDLARRPVRGELAPVRAAHRPAPRLRTDPGLERTAWAKTRAIRWGALDVQTLRAEDALTDGVAGVPMRVGVELPSPVGLITPDSAGQWSETADGRVVWTLRLESPEATGIRVHFSRFDLPPGARLVVAGAAGEQLFSYDGLGPIGKGHFWSNVISGDAVYVEYQPPEGSTTAPQLEIDRLSHIYRQPADTQEALLLPCQEDVNCHDVDPVAQASVGRMVFQDGGSYVCTGGLLNDLDPNTFAGYFLTANHCFSSQSAANTVEVRWFYETTSCNGAPTFGPTSLGAVLLETSSISDFTFLRLNDDPDAGQGFAAWNASAQEPSEPVVGIHHPGGYWKRVSFGSLTTDPPICSDFGLGLDKFWYLDWYEGITEGGSSGSPLFNADWEVVGQLFGACLFREPRCDNPQDYNVVYGRFDQTFPSIQSWLTAPPATDDAFEDNDELEQAVSLGQGDHELYLVDFFDFFAVELCETGSGLRITAAFDPADMDLDLQLLTAGGSLVAVAAEAGGTEMIDRDLPPGTYLVKLIKDHGWGGPYTLNVSIPNDYGDVNSDGAVDAADVFCILDALGGDFTHCTFAEADVNTCGGNGIINLYDILAVLKAIGGHPDCGGCP